MKIKIDKKSEGSGVVRKRKFSKKKISKFCFLRMPKICRLIFQIIQIKCFRYFELDTWHLEKDREVHDLPWVSLFKAENGFTETRFSAKFRGASGLSKKDVHLDLPFNSCSDWDLNNKKGEGFVA